MRRLLVLLLVACSVISTVAPRVAAQTGCEGTSGSATINGSPWATACVIAATSTACIDSMGGSYECFEILGADEAGTYAISIFLAQPPSQGQTYQLGGTSSHSALVLGATGFWVTGHAPYTGQVQVTVYDTAQGTIECNFSFMAYSLFPGPADVTVANGTFVGRLVGVAPKTWSNVKSLYRGGER